MRLVSSLLARLNITKPESEWSDEFRNSIVTCHMGLERDQTKLCFFASFHPQGLISPFVLAYLRALRENRFDIVLCATSPVLDDETLASALGLCHKVIRRENIGYDFASYRTCFDMVDDWPQARGILFTNDSILGPLCSVSPLFAEMDNRPEVFWGLNDNYQGKYHFQSFFLYCKAPVLESNAFLRFWMDLDILDDKKEIIARYEVGFSRRMIRAGLSHAVLFPIGATLDCCERLSSAFQYPEIFKKKTVNTTRYCWYELIEYLNYPFLKSEIPRDNHYKSQQINKVPDILKRALPESSWGYIQDVIAPLDDNLSH